MPHPDLSSPVPPTVLLNVDETVDISARSGVQRVVVKLARELASRAELQLVRWNAEEGSLRFCDSDEFDRLFGRGTWPAGLRPRLEARALRRRFGDLLANPGETWLLQPEIPYHTPDGLQAFATAVTQAREYGVRTAALVYDLIPVTNADYADHRARHLRYLAELTRLDLLLPISASVGAEYERFMGGLDLQPPPVAPVLLAESDRAQVERAPAARERTILAVGTVEPRKRQLEVLRAYAKARAASPALAALPLVVVGSLHGAVAKAFETLVARTPGVSYRAYLPEAELEAAWAEAAFSVFASDDEGYGLPVAESLARGVPCVAADVAPITEIAGGAGVLHVDVSDVDAIAAALIELAERPERRDALRAEAALRRLRTWGDYAADVVTALAEAPRRTTAPPERPVTVAAPGDPSAARADIVAVRDAAASDAWVLAAAAVEVPELLSHRMVAGDPAGPVAELDLFRRRLSAIARVEAGYAKAALTFQGEWASRPVFLRIVISTYNRRTFVTRNVEWLLAEVVRGRPDIELVVIDNASTDGTAEALEAFRGKPVRVIVNPANVGMLGNMRECSRLPGAEYVWLIGDDDFIVPGEVDALLRALKGEAFGAPLAYLNFAVYHREQLTRADTPPRLQAEGAPLAPHAIRSGMYPVNVAAAQHDNLFTAIYINIWRADVLAAAYDHPFDGRPFGDLTESIPCTKTILESFGEAPCYWHKPVAIVGNGHNSWSRHRPRWHGLLMPQALHLARDAGVDATVLRGWAEQHGVLFEEARATAFELGRSVEMAPEEYALSWPSFRRRVSIGTER